MSNIKTFKRGETIYKESEKPSSVLFVQSGTVQLVLTRNRQNVELCTVGASQVLGEHALAGVTNHPHSAIAVTEVKVVELALDAVRAQVEAAAQIQKVLTRSLCERTKSLMKDVRTLKLERDTSPCPPDQTAKVFASVFHAAKTKSAATEGTAGDKSVVHGAAHSAGAGAAVSAVVNTDWTTLRQYAQRMFLESPKRFEMAINILVKLGWASYEMVHPEDDPDGSLKLPLVIGTVTFRDLSIVEQFFEFYQYHYFKGGKEEFLRFDERALQIAQSLIDLTRDQVAVRNQVRVSYTKLIEQFKSVLGFQLNNDHWGLLEGKGLFVKRQSQESDVELQFDRQEFEITIRNWKVLREVERWNEKGFVDPNEPVESKSLKKEVAAGPAPCPSCGHVFEVLPRFCSECGTKFAAAA